MCKTVVLLNIFVENMIPFISRLEMNKKNSIYLIKKSYDILAFFTVTFDQFNASFLDFNFFNKNSFLKYPFHVSFQ